MDFLGLFAGSSNFHQRKTSLLWTSGVRNKNFIIRELFWSKNFLILKIKILNFKILQQNSSGSHRLKEMKDSNNYYVKFWSQTFLLPSPSFSHPLRLLTPLPSPFFPSSCAIISLFFSWWESGKSFVRSFFFPSEVERKSSQHNEIKCDAHFAHSTKSYYFDWPNIQCQFWLNFCYF